MKNKSIIIIIVILTVLISGTAFAYDNGDFQIWNTDNQEIKVAKNVKFGMEQEFRWGKNAGDLYYQHYDWMAIFGFDKMLDLAMGYRQVFDRLPHKKWREENQPNITATLKYDLWKFKLDDRNRLEYRHFRYKDDSLRYRNRFGIKLPLEFEKLKLTLSPYVSDEIFITSDSTGFNENRFCSGMEIELTKYVKADFYYMFKSNKVYDGKWNSANVLGTKIKIAF